MKQISSSLTSKLRTDSVIERDYIIFKDEAVRRYLWFNLYDDCYKDGNFVGTFIMKRIEIIYNDNDLEFKQKEFNAYKEYKLDDGTWESINYGTFIVQSIEDSDTKEEIKVTAYDYGLKFAKKYETNLDFSNNKTTIKDVLFEACMKCDIELATSDFTNSNFIVDSNQFEEGTMFGNVVCAVAGISCNFAKIKEDNKLYLELKNDTDVIIEASDYEVFDDKRDTQPYNAVSLGVSYAEGENVTIVADGIDPKNAKFLSINDNPFAYTEEKRQNLITGIFDKINGFGYSSVVIKNCMFPQLECGDLIKVRNKNGELVNTIVLRPSFESTQINIEAPSTIKSTVNYLNPTTAYDIAKRAEIIVNKQELIIQSIVSQTDEQNQKIAQITQTVDELNSKISDIADITVSAEDTDAKIELNEINESEPIRLVVRPMINNISYIYPRNNLYPSNDLFMTTRKIRFHNNTTQQDIDYELPCDLLYFDDDNYDEFILDYEGQSCMVNKKVGYNSDGTTYVLSELKIIQYEYPKILLTEGDYVISILNHDKGYIFARLMAKNIYTTQFYTKAETDSIIKQTSNEINLSVNQKLTNYSTTSEMNSAITLKANEINQTVSQKVGNNEIISKINQSAESIQINANKISLEGKQINLSSDNITINSTNFNVDKNGTIKAANGIIGGWTITNDLLKCSLDDYEVSIMPGNNTYKDFLVVYDKTNQSYPFFVRANGYLNATNANIQGTISSSSINGSTISGGSISISRGIYYFNMGLSTSNPNCSGLNVGSYGIKAYSGITATNFAITDGDTGKSYSLQIRDYNGRVHYLTFTGGILTAWEYI